jgi:DNA-binding response OmpR family regulator
MMEVWMSRPGRILIVDGDEAIRELVASALADEGYEVAVVADTASGLACVASFHPKLILLDLMRPRHDGKGLVDAYRAAAGYAVPIVALSTAPDFSEMARGLGAAVCIAKPFDLAQFLDCIQRQLSTRAV